MKTHDIVLLPQGEKTIRKRRRWLYDGAFEPPCGGEPGDLLRVLGRGGRVAGHAFLGGSGPIRARMIHFEDSDPLAALQASIRTAVGWRRHLFADEDTDCYRLINGEGDGVPGLVVDRYAEALVLQISTAGIDRLRDTVVATLLEETRGDVRTIREKSNQHSRRHEGLPPAVRRLWGEPLDHVEVRERGVRMNVDLVNGQKTGMFLDMREMRSVVGGLAAGRRVLDCFCYIGGFSLYAALGGAETTTSVDLAPQAVENCRRNFELNELPLHNATFQVDDVFAYLAHQDLEFDLVVLDPPAFAKRKEHLERAQRAYREINRLALQRMPHDSLLLTCSCSSHLARADFEATVARAVQESGRRVRIIGRQALAADHCFDPSTPEMDYLKSLLLHVA